LVTHACIDKHRRETYVFVRKGSALVPAVTRSRVGSVYSAPSSELHARGIANSPYGIIAMTNEQLVPTSHVDVENSHQFLQHRNALRSLLELPLLTAMQRLASEGDFDQSALREELQTVCAVAKRNGVRAEQVLIAVKEIWAELPAARDVARTANGKPFMTQVVTMALDEYYSSREPSS
jgi:hypothetical protein